MSSVESLLDNAKVHQLQIFVISVCFVLNVLDGFDVAALAYVAPVIINEWEISSSDLGFAFSSGLVGTAFGAMFLAPWGDRIGRRPMILLSLVVIGLSMIATPSAVGVVTLSAIRAINGLGVGCLLASLTTIGSEFSPARHRNLAISIISSGFMVGAILGGLLSAILIPLHGWEAVFYAGALFSILMFGVVLCLPESPVFLSRQRTQQSLFRLNAILLRLKLEQIQQLPELSPIQEPPARLGSLFGSDYRRNTYCIWAAFCTTFLTLYFVQNWLPTVLTDIGFSIVYAVYGGMLFNAGGLIGILFLGFFSRRLGATKVVATSLLAAGSVMLAWGYLPSDDLLIAGLILVLGFLTMSGFIGLYVVAAQIYPTSFRATGIGWAIGAGRFGSVISPVLGGYLISLGWKMDASFALYASPLLAAAIAVSLLRTRKI